MCCCRRQHTDERHVMAKNSRRRKLHHQIVVIWSHRSHIVERVNLDGCNQSCYENKRADGEVDTDVVEQVWFVVSALEISSNKPTVMFVTLFAKYTTLWADMGAVLWNTVLTIVCLLTSNVFVFVSVAHLELLQSLAEITLLKILFYYSQSNPPTIWRCCHLLLFTSSGFLNIF